MDRYALFVYGRKDGETIAEGRDVMDFDTLDELKAQLFAWPGSEFYPQMVEQDNALEIVGEHKTGDGYPVLNWSRQQGWYDPISGSVAYRDLEAVLTIHEVHARICMGHAPWMGDLSHLMLAIATEGSHKDCDDPRFVNACLREFPREHRIWKHLEHPSPS